MFHHVQSHSVTFSYIGWCSVTFHHIQSHSVTFRHIRSCSVTFSDDALPYCFINTQDTRQVRTYYVYSSTTASRHEIIIHLFMYNDVTLSDPAFSSLQGFVVTWLTLTGAKHDIIFFHMNFSPLMADNLIRKKIAKPNSVDNKLEKKKKD